MVLVQNIDFYELALFWWTISLHAVLHTPAPPQSAFRFSRIALPGPCRSPISSTLDELSRGIDVYPLCKQCYSEIERRRREVQHTRSRVPGAGRRVSPHEGTLSLSDTMYSSISFRKPTPPQKRQKNVNLKF